MTHYGKVHNGVIVLDPPAALPEGSAVLVQTVAEKPRSKRKTTVPRPEGAPLESKWRKGDWKKCIGSISDKAADEMLAFIEESFEKVNPEDWK